MGTELQYSMNAFPAFPKNNGDVVGIGFDTSDTREFSKNRFLKNILLQESMDRLLEECNRESLRNSILKHERIFKEQVRELHRLYRVQKMLMAELRSKDLNLHYSSNTPGAIKDPSIGSGGPQTSHHSHSIGDRHHYSAQLNSEYNFQHGHNTEASLSSPELSICPVGENLRTRWRRGFDLDLPAEEDAATSVGTIRDKMSTDGPRLCSDGENDDVELTLSIGCGGNQDKSRHRSDLESGRQPTLSTPGRPEPEECGGGDSSSSFDRESLQQKPPWLFQSLSLNRT